MSGKVNSTRDEITKRVEKLRTKNGFSIWSFRGQCYVACVLAEAFSVPDEMPYERRSDPSAHKRSAARSYHTVFITKVFIEENIRGKPAALLVVANRN